MARWSFGWCLAATLAVVGCARTEDPGTDGQSHWVRCDEEDACPDGWSCRSARCVQDEALELPDAAPSSEPELSNDAAPSSEPAPSSDATPSSDAAPSSDPAPGSTVDAGQLPLTPDPDSSCDTGVEVNLAPPVLARRLARLLFDRETDAALEARLREAAPLRSGHVGCLVDELLTLPEAHVGIQRFYAAWLGAEAISETPHDPELFPEYTEATRQALREELLRFTSYVTLEDDGLLSTLLLAPYGFVNRDSATLYGVEQASSELTRTELPPERGGVFNQAQFLSTRATERLSSPTQRGFSILELLVCQKFGAPPPEAKLTFTPDSVSTTTRAYYEQSIHSQDSCAGCHRLADSVGFAFESFDAVGRFRERENGFPIDTSGQIAFPGEGTIEFTGSADLMRALAEAPTVHRCLAQTWLEHALQRTLLESEANPAPDLVEAATTPQGFDLRRLIVSATQTELFLSED